MNDTIRQRMNESLASRELHPSLLYLTAEQSHAWEHVHRTHAPIHTDTTLEETYSGAYETVASGYQCGDAVQVVSLGCGSGNKDAVLIETLVRHGIEVEYHPCDISTTLSQSAAERIRGRIPTVEVFPKVLDLEISPEMSWPPRSNRVDIQRLYLFLGILPNMSPETVGRCLGHLLSLGDRILLSANLIPTGRSAAGSLHSVLPQYANPETEEWLNEFWKNFGTKCAPGVIQWYIGRDKIWDNVSHIEARFRFNCEYMVTFEGKNYLFESEDELTVFRSYRYTARLLREYFVLLGIRFDWERICPSGEEGLFFGTSVIQKSLPVG